jgi:hypothetical protein
MTAVGPPDCPMIALPANPFMAPSGKTGKRTFYQLSRGAASRKRGLPEVLGEPSRADNLGLSTCKGPATNLYFSTIFEPRGPWHCASGIDMA